MGLFDLFRKKQQVAANKKQNYSAVIQNARKSIEEDDWEIAQLQAAEEKYEQDKNTQSCIQTFEKILLKGTRWNSFNYHMTLVRLYLSAERNDEAWAYLNRLLILFPDEYNTYKVRNEQFRILKKEKKYKDALRMLAVSHVLKTNSPNGSYFSREKFEKDGKTTAKGAGISSEQFHVLSGLIENVAKSGRCDEADVFKVVDDFLKA